MIQKSDIVVSSKVFQVLQHDSKTDIFPIHWLPYGYHVVNKETSQFNVMIASKIDPKPNKFVQTTAGKHSSCTLRDNFVSMSESVGSREVYLYSLPPL